MKSDVDKVRTELTYEKLKTYKGFENSTEAEAEKQIDAIKRLAKVLLYMYIDEEQKNNNSQKNEQ